MATADDRPAEASRGVVAQRPNRDEIQERYLRRAISEVNELGDELLALGDELHVPVLGSGHPLGDILLLKHSPTQSEIHEGVAFFGRAGQALLKSLERLAVDPLAVYGTNCLKFGTEEPEQARVWLARELHIVQPKLLVAMGERDSRLRQRARLPPLPRARRGTARRAAELHADDRGARDARHRRVPRRAGREDALLERVQGPRYLVGRASRRTEPGRLDAGPPRPTAARGARARRACRVGRSRGAPA